MVARGYGFFSHRGISSYVFSWDADVKELQISGKRLWNSLTALGEVGAYRDERTGLKGVNRLALTDADAQGRRLVKRWFEEAGLEVRVDRVGNVIGRRKGRRSGDAPVMSGSHIDSVPTAGAFDGCLGVLGALECVRTLNDLGMETDRPLEVAFFTDEEGCRFGTDMLGSAAAVGRLELETVYELKDRDGLTVRGELERHGFLGTAPERLPPPHAYVECHIEQGPILRAAGVDLGVVTGVQAISWQDVSITGKSSHAGTTPMSLRSDAGLCAARIAVRLHEMALSGRYGEMRATMGAVQPHPGMVNIVPGRARCTVDLRNPDDAMMAAAEKDLEAFYRSLEKEMGVTITWRQTARTPRIAFSEQVQAVLARHMDAAGHTHQRIMSGAGHDAQEIASLCPTAMIFVPGEYDGISHNPREYSTPEACTRGVNVLLRALVELATA
ncbi:MAG TPA: M20 family metallo-hydrolase [Myxococcales bacterium]|nr:M20 family metallo-hydrolase [Myxococcales bacterium]